MSDNDERMSDNDESKALTQADAKRVPDIAATDMDMAKALVASGFFPNVATASQALVKIQLGRELGFGPVAAMMGVHVWQDKHGRPSIQLSANLIANLIRRHARYDFRVLEHDEKVCAIGFTRDSQPIGESRFSIDDAKRAGLTTKDIWLHYPKNMLYAAAMRNGAKWFCSEVLLGAPMPLSDAEPEGGSVDMETGEVFEGEAVPVVSAPPEGYKPNWDAFWATAKELGLTREEVHAAWEVPAENGALRDWANERADSMQQTIMEVVAEMTARLSLIAHWKAEAAKAPAARTGRVKPRPETTEHAAEIEEARRSFFAAASEMELSTHGSLHKALRLPCEGHGNHNDGDKNACKSLDEHRNMLTMDGRGTAGAWRTLTRILRGEEAAPWVEAEPEPEYAGEPEEAAQAAFSE